MGKLIRGINDLATLHPELAKQWNYGKNTNLSPNGVYSGSTLKVWWICSKGHEWPASIRLRSNGTGCPVCANRCVVKGENDMASIHPELASEWNYSKNTPLSPEEVSCGSDKKVWWKCSLGHEWEAKIYSRSEGSGCPQCAKENRTSFPEQSLCFYINQYYPDAINGDNKTINMELDVLIPSRNIAIEYDGLGWHSSKYNISNDNRKNELCKSQNIRLIRIREQGLPSLDNCVCVYRSDNYSSISLNNAIVEVLSLIDSSREYDVDTERDSSVIYSNYIFRYKSNSIAAVAPELLNDWDYENNQGILPDSLQSKSMKKVWWKCSVCGYSWKTSVQNRVDKRSGCPACCNHDVVVGFNDLTTTNPEIVREWNYKKNGDLKPEMFTHGTLTSVWWKCSVCGFEWKTKISNRSKGSGCPICSNSKLKTGVNDLATIRPDLADEWNFEKNGELKPTDIVAGTSRKVWWKCSKNHEWEANVGSRVAGKGCPYCSHKKLLVGFNDLATLYPNLAKEWNTEKNGDLKPTDVICASGKSVWWKCSKCGYEWQTRPADRVTGKGCKMCGRLLSGKARSKRVMCIETNQIFSSCIVAATEFNVSQSAISNCCRGIIQTVCGYHWRFIE